MAGILDKHSRFLDSIITEEGKRQIAFGKLKAEFYSFSDIGSYYRVTDQFDSGSISDNNTYRFALEATNLPQDRITFEQDDSGRLKVKEFINVGSSSIRVIDGTIITGSLQGNTRVVTNSSEDFILLASNLLSSSINNYQNQYILGSPDLIDERFTTFRVDPLYVRFDITDDKPILSQINGGTQEANINSIESLFADEKLSHLPNFQYLPPVNKPRLGSDEAKPLGIYPCIGQKRILSFNDLRKQLHQFSRDGFSESIYFSQTSKNNRILCQLFELSDGKLTKLDIIDFGIFTLNNDEVSLEEKQKAEEEGRQLTTKHVFFVGKLYQDDNGSDTFVNIFTLIFQ